MTDTGAMPISGLPSRRFRLGPTGLLDCFVPARKFPPVVSWFLRPDCPLARPPAVVHPQNRLVSHPSEPEDLLLRRSKRVGRSPAPSQERPQRRTFQFCLQRQEPPHEQVQWVPILLPTQIRLPPERLLPRFLAQIRQLRPSPRWSAQHRARPGKRNR